MKIAGYLKSSFIDYPDTLASVVYTPECNFNCGFCHNKDLVYCSEDLMHQDQIFKHLDTRKHILDGVVVSGGEPTLQKNIVPFIRQVKKMGFKVKLDTNGHKPQIIEQLLDEKLLDYIAMDIKNSQEKYKETIDKLVFNFDTIKESIELIKKAYIDYEFRTTWIKEYHESSDLAGIGVLIKDSKKYVFQQYEYSNKQIKDQTFNYYTLEEMGRFREQIKVQYNIEDVIVRGRF